MKIFCFKTNSLYGTLILCVKIAKLITYILLIRDTSFSYTEIIIKVSHQTFSKSGIMLSDNNEICIRVEIRSKVLTWMTCWPINIERLV